MKSSVFLYCVLLLCSAAASQSNLPQQPAPAPQQNQPASPPDQASQVSAPAPPKGFVLEDSTPVRLRINRTVSSADAHVGDTVDFEVLEDVSVKGTLVIPKGGLAFATVTEAQPKRRMARGGKLDINIDYVKLLDGDKAALRAVKDMKGGGHTGAMVGGMVATGILFFPAAPSFFSCTARISAFPRAPRLPLT
jgi:hypothetical protein